jgi:hypothetical protein
VQRKLGLTVTAVNSFDRRFDGLLKSLEGEEADEPEALSGVLKDFKEKFALLKEEILPPEFMYRGSRENALRGGHASQMLLMIAMNLGGFPFPPTEMEKRRIAELEERVDKLVDRLNRFIETDMTALNSALEAAGIKSLRLPARVEL